MDATLPILILAIPLGMFLVLGLAGYKMSHKLAGTLGCLGMGTTLVLAYVTAFTAKLMSTALSISSSEMRMAIMLRRVMNPYTPQQNIIIAGMRSIIALMSIVR